ncbi:hypothetical protein [Pseudomonas migulae]|uniref:hypothetical protein n=1 Tax=Pseudomonas migulae TaxID=78543 RepID=UPI000B075A05|nr:hypothetical protein [Pseudomonas migulae]
MVSLFPHTATATSNPIQQWGLSVAGMRGDPALVADALMLSRCTYGQILKSPLWAFVYNLIGIPRAAMGVLGPAVLVR